MSIDMKQFHSVFFEESHEHIEEMEHFLLDMNVDNPDMEELNSIFRAAHSIKGGSGIFGFDALGSLTHIMESLLDKLRQNIMPPTTKMVDVLLSSVDLLKVILQAYRTESAIDWVGVQKMSDQLEELTCSSTEKNEQGYGFFTSIESESLSESYGFFEQETYPKNDDEPGFFVDESSTKTNHAKDDASNMEIELKESSSKSKTVDVQVSESSSIRVDVIKVDHLINLVGEIVITQSMLTLLGQQLDGSLGEKFQSVTAELERNTREIQEAVMSIRMLPISFVFNRFPRVVRDLSSKLGKTIELVIEGGETELDKGLTEKLVDPLTHLVRNSIDHGIEPSGVRVANGKPAAGTVTLRAAQQGGSIVICINDDGGGLSRSKILAKALEKNIPVGDNPSDDEVWQLIFSPGFSTAAEVTDVSGRGVGLDVVKRNVKSLGGRIDIDSQEGVGTTFTIHLPLTLAIVDGMCVSVGDQVFIIPLVNIVESMQPSIQSVETLVGEDELLYVRDEYWPILSLYKAMNLIPNYTEVHKGVVVLIETNKRRFALFVDALVGQQQVVIKSLEQHYKRVAGVAGATIMGDGRVALILDVESLTENIGQLNVDYSSRNLLIS